MGYTYTKNSFVVYLKHRFNLASCIFIDQSWQSSVGALSRGIEGSGHRGADSFEHTVPDSHGRSACDNEVSKHRTH